mgnify:CR=1 FL=1
MEQYDIKTKTENYTPFSDQGGKVSPYTKKDIDAKFSAVNFLLFGVVIILLVMVATLVVDSFHINSAIYKEYSQKTASVEATQKTNGILLKQIQDLLEQSKQDREIIKQLLKK